MDREKNKSTKRQRSENSNSDEYTKHLYKLFIDTCTKGDLPKLKKIMESHKDVDPSYNNSQALKLAARHGKVDIIIFLLKDERVDVTADSNRVIREACMGEYDAIVKILLDDPRVDPSDSGNECIRYAAFFGDEAIVRMLMRDSRVDPYDNSKKSVVLEDKSAMDIAREKKHFHLIPILERQPESSESLEMDAEELNRILNKYQNGVLGVQSFSSGPPVERKLDFEANDSDKNNNPKMSRKEIKRKEKEDNSSLNSNTNEDEFEAIPVTPTVSTKSVNMDSKTQKTKKKKRKKKKKRRGGYSNQCKVITGIFAGGALVVGFVGYWYWSNSEKIKE